MDCSQSGQRTVTHMNASLSGKRILLTGAGGHLGGALATGMINAGADLVAVVRSADQFRKSGNGIDENVEVYQADLSIKGDVDTLFESLSRHGIDGFVNNAFSSAPGRLDENTLDSWREGIEGTLIWPSYLMMKSIPLLIRTKGAIVNIASMYGVVAPDPGNYTKSPEFDNPPNYGAAKAGLIQLTKYGASYLGQHGVRVNSVSPGPFPSDGVQKNNEFITSLARQVPLGRVGMAREIVGPVVFLLSDAASYVSGHNLVVDGGWTAR